MVMQLVPLAEAVLEPAGSRRQTARHCGEGDKTFLHPRVPLGVEGEEQVDLRVRVDRGLQADLGLAQAEAIVVAIVIHRESGDSLEDGAYRRIEKSRPRRSCLCW